MDFALFYLKKNLSFHDALTCKSQYLTALLKKVILAITAFSMLAFSYQKGFLNEQLRFQRVRTANKEKMPTIQADLKRVNLKVSDFRMLMIAYKQSSELDLYVKVKSDSKYKKFKTYKICSKSGVLGPKYKQGDAQVPEGLYHVNRFNPSSSFYLSLGLNYPNEADKKRSRAKDLGGDIFIHGNCVTIGCLPMTDDAIKEIYMYAVHAKNNGQNKIPVYIFPFKMTEQNMLSYKNKFKNNKALLLFWENLKMGYNAFQAEKNELSYSIGGNGEYLLR